MKAFRHFCTITKHKFLVMDGCFRVGLIWQGITHDLSKYSLTEFRSGMRYYQGNRSPNAAEREDKGYSDAWMHHKGRNRHHLEYWNDLNPATKNYEPVKMPIRFVKEMFCDRVAASKIYQGKNYTNEHPLTYFVRGNARQKMHPDTADLLEEWLTMLAKEGEKATFAHLKKISNKKDYPESK